MNLFKLFYERKFQKLRIFVLEIKTNNSGTHKPR